MSGSGYIVQLASFPYAYMAEEEIVTLRQKYAKALQDTELNVISVVLNGQTYYRVVTKAEDEKLARGRCDSLKAMGKQEGCAVLEAHL